MKNKMILMSCVFFFLNDNVNAMNVEIKDFGNPEFSHVAKALEKRKILEFKNVEYVVLKEAPVDANSKGKYKINPCYKNGCHEPKLIEASQISSIEPFATFKLYQVVTDEHKQYVTLSFTSGNNLDWETTDAECLWTQSGRTPYWHREITEFGHNFRTVNFLLKKI